MNDIITNKIDKWVLDLAKDIGIKVVHPELASEKINHLQSVARAMFKVIEEYQALDMDSLRIVLSGLEIDIESCCGKRVKLPGISITDFKELSPEEATDQLIQALPNGYK